MHELNNNWTLWLHLPHDVDWTIASYKKVYSFDNLENCITLIENINREIVEKCMLFIMKNNIKPIWEDSHNNKGGSLSYKIVIENVYHVWKILTYSLIGQSITDNKDLLNSINGISISPKKNFCIIKFWLSNTDTFSKDDIQKLVDISYNNYTIENSSDTFDPLNIHKLCNIDKQLCIFKKHEILY